MSHGPGNFSIENCWRNMVARRCPWSWLLLPLLWLLSVPWWFVVCASHHIYRLGMKNSRKAVLPVVSVGNISVGGTGKTTTCMYLARELGQSGVVAGIVLRGYGRRSRGALLVSDGRNILATAEQAGDEAWLLAKQLPECPVAVAERREAAVELIAEETEAQIVLLDDGFQYYRMARDVDLVLLDAYTPTGSDWLFPAGLLREPYSHLSRATDIWITHSDIASKQQLAHMEKIARRYAPGASVVITSHALDRLTTWEGEPVGIELLSERPVIAIAGIGNPEAVFAHVAKLAKQPVSGLVFPDHHDYSSSDWDTIAASAAHCEHTVIVTTPKDAVKMSDPPAGLNVYVMHPTLDVQAGHTAVEDLVRRIWALARSAPASSREVLQ